MVYTSCIIHSQSFLPMLLLSLLCSVPVSSSTGWTGANEMIHALPGFQRGVAELLVEVPPYVFGRTIPI